jgi:hypothetical protein
VWNANATAKRLPDHYEVSVLLPFDKAYEGTPFHDFVGRLDDWEWPKASKRS